MYVAFSDEPTPYSLAASRGLERSKDGNFAHLLVVLERLNGRSTRAGLYDNPLTMAIVKAFWRNGVGRVHRVLFGAYGCMLVMVVSHAVVPEVSNYFLSSFNWTDFLNYALILVTGLPNIVTEDESRRCILSVLIVLMGFKVLFYMRAYTTLVRTILQ
ncbi:hypothetical protein T492DRAFT_886958, partial [Pavlovales sp. CCMP2436]